MPKPHDRIKRVRADTKQRDLLLHLNDYEWATSQYRSGRAVGDIANDIGVTRAALFDYFSRERISRDLTSEIRNRTNVLLAGDNVDMTHAIMPTTDEEVIAINATMQAALIREHRADIRRMRKLAMVLLHELEIQTVDHDLFDDLGTMLRSENKEGVDKLNEAYKKIISTPGRTDGLKKLSDVLKTVIMLERQAFGMRDDFEDSEIRKGKMASSQTHLPTLITDDYEDITRQFQRVLDGVSDAVIVREESRPVQPSEGAVPATAAP